MLIRQNRMRLRVGEENYTPKRSMNVKLDSHNISSLTKFK